MPEKIAVELGDVQKTLLLPLWGRAYESKKPHPLLIDRTAVRIMDEMEYDFSQIAEGMSDLTQLAWIMRSVCVDGVVRKFLHQHPNGTIVNLGCGLDTTFDRIDNGMLHWYDLDLPDVISLRKHFIQETHRRKFIAASFLDINWLKEIKADEAILFIAAGVFYYFEEKEVMGFLKRLAGQFPGSEILFDVSSPYGVKVANRMVIRKSGLDEKSFLKWGLEDISIFPVWDKRFRVKNSYFYFGEQGRSLSLKNKFFGFISDRLKVQYMVHLELMK